MTRHLAKGYTRRLLGRNYTVEDAKAEVFLGYGGPGEAGYNISHGRIECPAFSGKTFRFEELAEELRREEMEPEFEL